MAEKLEAYRCNICGNLVMVLHGGKGQLVCCGQPMEKLEEQTADSTVEKHVPVIEEVEGGVKVKVGSVPHPMAAEHYISWIQVIKKKSFCLKFLAAGDAPESTFPVKKEDIVKVREYCTVHNLWSNK
ncbi:desulfoferrodoxin [bacterium]|nr:desulfoferrodoxin [bacterium]